LPSAINSSEIQIDQRKISEISLRI